MAVTRANVEDAKAFIRARLGNPYVYGGALSPTAVRQGTDCSEVVQTVCEKALGRYRPGRQAEGATTESYRRKRQGGGLPDWVPGPFGTIDVARPRDIPADAAVKIALHHGPGGGANSHMWCEVDGMRVESRGGGVGLITQPRAFAIDDRYATAWCYLPGPIVDDGTPVAPEVVILGRAFENSGDRVRKLQAALNGQGANLDPDGEFGALTEQAVRDYQRGRGLDVDGIAGPATLAALGLKFGSGSPAAPVTPPSSLVALLRRAMTPTEQPNARLAELLPHFAEAMRAAEITNARRAAAWCSQIGHESAGLRYMAEIQTNGPGWSEDRRIYRGRGPIQLTWAGNYRKFGQWCAAKGYITDPELFVKQPTLVEQPRWGFLAASWYWLKAGPRPGRINEYADGGDILAVSRCVNGWIEGRDPVGWADRRTRYLNCMAMGNELLALTTPTQGDDELSAEAERWIKELRDAFLEPTESLSPIRKPGEGKIAPLVRFLRYMDGNTHVPFMKLMAELGSPNALAELEEVATMDLAKYPGRTQEQKEIAQAILAEVTNPTVAAPVTIGSISAPPDTDAVVAAVTTAVNNAAASLQPATIETAAPTASQPAGTTGQRVGQLVDALEGMDLSADLSPELRATLETLATILNAKIGVNS